jgi:hypothetical protein
MRNLITGISVTIVGGVLTVVAAIMQSQSGGGWLACFLFSSIIFFLMGLTFLTFGIIETAMAASERKQFGISGSRDDEDEDEDEEEDEDDEDEDDD